MFDYETLDIKKYGSDYNEKFYETNNLDQNILFVTFGLLPLNNNFNHS